MPEEQEKKEEFRTTLGGTLVNRVYTPSDLAGLKEEDLGLPGEYPFTRHIMPNGYRGRLWTMRQYAGFGTVEETNERYKYLYQQGQTGFSVAFHLPTQEGYDSDHPLAEEHLQPAFVTIVDSHSQRVDPIGIPSVALAHPADLGLIGANIPPAALPQQDLEIAVPKGLDLVLDVLLLGRMVRSSALGSSGDIRKAVAGRQVPGFLRRPVTARELRLLL